MQDLVTHLANLFWMLVDAIQRRPPYYWYIVVFMPFGPLVYFFAIKIHDYDLGWFRGMLRAGGGGRLVMSVRHPAP